ncbi:MAG: hypothetical protein QOF30_1147 [Acidimicrobiaceae bacterium]|nr:hypothetical protein [Acidimicrobiaceae bacterium]
MPDARGARLIRPGAGRSSRVALSLVMLLGAVLLVLGNRALRTAELVVSGGVVSLGAGHTVLYRPGHFIFFETSASRTVGLQVTASCTAIFLMVPFLLLAAFMMLIPRVSATRLVVAAVVGAVVVFWLNQLRLLIIAWATHNWGIGPGFDWSHILAGSLVTTFSMLIALYLFFRISLTGRRSAV